MAGLTAHIQQGTLRALAVSSKERSPVLPDVPTVAEAGVPGYEAVSWIGMLTPAGTPVSTIDKLWAAVNTAMQDPAARNILVNGGSEVVASKPEEFRQVIASDYAKYAKLSDLFHSEK
jgi:tripartite-type tricarboxylate transporter receptor subunit TctC